MLPGRKKQTNKNTLVSLQDLGIMCLEALLSLPLLSAQVSGLGISRGLPRQMAEAFAASSIQWDRADFVPCLLVSDYLQYKTQSS